MQCLHLETPSFHKSSQYLLIVISGSTKNKLQMASFRQRFEQWKLEIQVFVRNFTRNIIKLISQWRHHYGVFINKNMTSSIVAPPKQKKNSAQLFGFCGLRNLNQQIFTVKCFQCTVKVFLDWQYAIGVKSFREMESVIDKKTTRQAGCCHHRHQYCKSPMPTKFKVVLSAGKLMATNFFFWGGG